jgi:hypothetical protein
MNKNRVNILINIKDARSNYIAFQENISSIINQFTYKLHKNKKIDFNKTLLHNFKNLHLNKVELTRITQCNRKDLYEYLNLDYPSIKKFNKQIINQLKKLSNTHIAIEGSEIGGFLILSLIEELSKANLENNLTYTINIKSSPLSLYSYKNIHKFAKSIKLENFNLLIPPNSWLRDFPSLYKCSSKIPWKYCVVFDIKDLDLKSHNFLKLAS